MSFGVGRTRGSDLVWLWPAAVALGRPLAWKLPHATGVALKQHTHTKKVYQVPQKLDFCEIFIGITLILSIDWERLDIFLILTHFIQEHVICLSVQLIFFKIFVLFGNNLKLIVLR